ncbi:MAG: serine/threonine protein kinase, partial [Planctomycetota bacterium]|nr:serine/threonine protein kinase [Planctomycetota bacterium]
MTSDLEHDLDLEHDIDAVLKAIDGGEVPTEAWLRERFPERWRELSDALDLQRHVLPSFPPGTRVGSWRIVRKLGRGSAGTVYHARSRAGESVTLKVLHPHLTMLPRVRQRFSREARAMRREGGDATLGLRGVHVVTHVGVDLHVLEMAYTEGITLASHLQNRGRLPPRECIALGIQLCQALEQLHEADIVHRDLKPSNILLESDGRVRLLDLGIAWLTDEVRRVTETGDFVGSLAYAAPEQFLHDRADPDRRVDLYALGAVLFEAATGTIPWSRSGVSARTVLGPPSPRVLEPAIPEALDRCVRSLLRPRAAQRPASAQSVRDTLRNIDLAAASTPPPCPHDLDMLDECFDLAEASGATLIVTGGPHAAMWAMLRLAIERLRDGDGTITVWDGVDLSLLEMLARELPELARVDPTSEAGFDLIQSFVIRRLRERARDGWLAIVTGDLHAMTPLDRALFGTIAREPRL